MYRVLSSMAEHYCGISTLREFNDLKGFFIDNGNDEVVSIIKDEIKDTIKEKAVYLFLEAGSILASALLKDPLYATIGIPMSEYARTKISTKHKVTIKKLYASKSIETKLRNAEDQRKSLESEGEEWKNDNWWKDILNDDSPI
jgi:hypothetical protein